MGNTRLIRNKLHLIWLVFLLNACAMPLLLLSPQGQMMWALMKPLVGLDPNDVGLFEQPMVKDRMQAILGPQYGNAMKILATADEIQQQGPLYYVISNHSPIPDIADKAGFVWNADNNQMAVMLLTGGSPQIFAEKLVKDTVNTKVEQTQEQITQAGKDELVQQVPLWPTELTAIIEAKQLTNP
ncbi:hypothetical protein [Shewanella sp. HL-SH2]|uniref:hypothetical protein n=1 Tax=Shewanella sp. HL-SH2 TaxID=3436238 RepID=UPI003EBB7B20